MSAKETSRVYNYHFPMVQKKYAQPDIKCLSSMFLGLRATTLSRKKGIKVTPGETFRFRNKDKSQRSLVYLYEAGLHPDHAKTLEHIIEIYVKRDGEDTVLLGFLSAACPCIQLELTLGEDCELTHTSPRKAVFFNGFRLTLAKSPKSKLLPDREVWRRAKSVTMQANKELWVVEVHSSQKLRFNPLDDGKEYHILEVYSRENTSENIGLHVCCNKGMQSVGELVAGCNRTRLNLVFDDVFTLSHTSNTTSLFFSGYTVHNQSFEFKLKELNKYTEDPTEDSLKSPKVSLDQYYECYKRILAKVPAGTPRQQPTVTPKRAEVNLLSLSPLTAPLIFSHRASCEIFSATPRGIFWVPKQESDVSSLSNKLSTSRNSNNKVASSQKVFYGTKPPLTNMENKHLSSKLISPFNCRPNKGVSHIPLDKAIAVRDIVISDESLMGVTLISNASLGVCASGKELLSSFKDSASTSIEIMHFFTACNRNDENLLPPECRGYRIFLSWELGSLLNCEEIILGQVYDSSTAAKLLREHLNGVDPKQIKMILWTYHHNNHFSVYCINRVYSRVDVLDSIDWIKNGSSFEKRNDPGGYRAIKRLSDAFQTVTGKQFEDFSEWKIWSKEVPRQHPLGNACASYTKKFLRHYDGEESRLHCTIEIEKENQYRAEELFYLIFHDLNEVNPLPCSLEKFRPVVNTEGDHTSTEEIATSREEDASDEEDKTTSKKPEDGKKKVAKTPVVKTPVSDKKAKIARPSGQTAGDKRPSDVVTPRPAKQAKEVP